MAQTLTYLPPLIGLAFLAIAGVAGSALWTDRTATALETPFPNYTQIASRVPIWAWRAMRACSLLGGLGVVILLLTAPRIGLFLMWRVVIPTLPLLFLTAPGLWRNLCPLAAANQIPRWLRFTKAATPPAWLKEYGYVVAFGLFVCFVVLRRFGLDRSPIDSALLLFGAIAGAFTGGVMLKGKSGWCSTICPLLPVQRIYGQSPLVTIANAHCQPCVGCVKNCYDFNPNAAYLHDLNDPDSYWSGYRRFFVGAFPGLVLSFFAVPAGPPLRMLSGMAVYVAVSIATFALLNSFIKASDHLLTSAFGAIAFVVFYWFVAIKLGPPGLAWLIRLAAFVLAGTWFARTRLKEQPFLESIAVPARSDTDSGGGRSLTTGPVPLDGTPTITFLPDETVVDVEEGMSVLDLAEAAGLPLEAGCRMGICGADPVFVTGGASCTNPISDDERATLERLGLPDGARMACCLRPTGAVSISLTAPANAPAASIVRDSHFDYDPAVTRVVIIGNGIAGVSAADRLRRLHPEVAIDLVADEPHHLYNRMGIARLVYGRSAMNGLYLNPEQWYTDRNITAWLNTLARSIDPAHRSVILGSGETLAYDRLILATGASGRVPTLDGVDLRGVGVLRSAQDAINLRAHIQRVGARQAVIAGGGLLGLEAAHAIAQLGVHPIVLERSAHLLRRQLDPRAAQLLHDALEDLGIEIILEAEARAAHGTRGVEAVELVDGRMLPAQVLLIAAGISPNVALARSCGLGVNRGVLVDGYMRTDDPNVFAVGDAAEHAGQTPGLWASAITQAEVAAENAAGGSRLYEAAAPITMLKVVGVDLISIGRISPAGTEEQSVVIDDAAGGRYRKLVIDPDGRAAGAILLGPAGDVSAAVRSAVGRRADVAAILPELRRGDWACLER